MISLFAREDRDAKRQRWHEPEPEPFNTMLVNTMLDRGNSRRTIRAASATADRAREGEPRRPGGSAADIEHKGHPKTLFNNVMSRWAGGRVMALLALAVFGSPMVSAQGVGVSVVGKHDLTSATGTGLYRLTTPAGPAPKMCVFCHTPYSETAAAVPLWNGTLAPSAAYTTYNSLGTSGTGGVTTAVGSSSMVCFSCHDGASSRNMVINMPESGSAVLAGTWSGKAVPVTAGSLMPVWLNPGQDLRNDHPVGNQYGGGPIAGTVPAPTATIGTYANTLYRDTAFRSASSQLLNGLGVWWVDTTGGTTARERTDMQLYTRTGAVALGTGTVLTGAQPFVECGSCHDPHTNNTLFQRTPNTGSALCLTCHIK